MQLTGIRRLASKILKVGKSKIWFNSLETDKIKEAMTKEDVRLLIKDGLIKKKKLKEHSRGGARKLQEKKKRGRKRGFGKRKGTYKTRSKKKKTWIKKVRAQRKKLQELKKEKKLGKTKPSEIYKKIKGNFFRGKKHLEASVLEGKK